MSALFQSFCGMMDRLPAVAAKKAAAVQRRMLEADIAAKREESFGEAASVLAFCRFLESPGGGTPVVFRDVPLEHWTVYAQIIGKLVEAGELSPDMKDRFDREFGKVLAQAAA